MDDRVYQIILAVIPLIGTLITVFVIPFVKEKIGNEKLAKYEAWAQKAVEAAEMLWPNSGMGAEKKAYVIDFLTGMFNKNKVVITEEQLDVLIEAAVQELNKYKKNTKQTTTSQ